MPSRCCIATTIVLVVLVVAAAVVVALYFTVIKDDDDDTKGNETTTTISATTPVPMGLTLKGGWSPWKPWADCSATCGGGTQSRVRTCNNPEPAFAGANCVGKATETRNCAEYDCPDCSRDCSPGTLSFDCSYCKCDGTRLEGHVFDDQTEFGLADVMVYVVGHEWEPMAVTDRHGDFELEDFCLGDLQLKLQKKGYQPEESVYDVRGNELGATMILLEKPRFLTHPKGTGVFTSESFELTCSATGFPEVDTYEWFKDGDILPDSAQNPDMPNLLEVTDVTLEDAGVYQCRAVSAAGKTFSKKATMVVEASSSDTCPSNPEEHTVNLPSGCTAQVSSGPSSSIKLGACSGQRCRERGDSTQEQGKCCQPIEHSHVEVTCEGAADYSLPVVTKCGCGMCDEEGKRAITVEGTVYKAGTDPLETKRYVELRSMDQIQYSADDGRYSFMGEVEADYVTVTVVPDNSDEDDQVLRIELMEAVEDYNLDIFVSPPPPSVEVDPTQETTLDTADDDSVASRIHLPPNSIFDRNGNPVTDDIEVTVGFADPRSEQSLSRASGDFTFVDEEGIPQELQTFGVVRLSAKKRSGEKLYVSGKVPVSFDMEKLGIPMNPDTNQPDADLWTFSTESGIWNNLSPLFTPDEGTRRKRQTSGGNNNTAMGEADFSQVQWINCDKPIFRGNRCQISVFVYRDANFTEGFSGMPLTVYIKQQSGNGFVGRLSARTDARGHACIPAACGYVHIIEASDRSLQPYPSEEHDLPPGTQFTNLPNARVEYRAPAFGDLDVTGKGPTHSQAAGTCFNPNNTRANGHHFLFSMKNAPRRGRLDAVETRPNRTLSWYNGTGDQFREACMIRVRVLTHNQSSTDVVGQSFVHDANGAFLGTYTTGLRQAVNYEFERQEGSGAACVEVRCPRNVLFDQVSGGRTENVATRAHIQVLPEGGPKCRLVDVRDADAIYTGASYRKLVLDDVTNSTVSVIVKPDCIEPQCRYLNYYPGYYTAVAWDNRRATLDALNRCRNGYEGDYAVFDCADGEIPFDKQPRA